MPVNAGDTAENAGGEIGKKVGEASKELLGSAAKVPEAPHVQGNVDDAEVDEHAGDEAPPLAVEGERAEIGAEGDGLLGSGLEGGNSTEDHGGED